MRIDGTITLYKLEVFCLVVQLRSVTKAAERLGIAQPAVTAHMRQLEAKLETTLFRREGRAIAPTDAGERVYTWAQEVLGSGQELAHDITRFKDGLAGTVTIASTMAIGSYRLPDVTVGFQLRHPHAHIITYTTNPVQATEMVRSGSCDFGVLLLDPSQRVEELVVERLWQEPLLLVAKAGSRHLKTKLDLKRISDVPFVTAPRGLATRAMEEDQLRAQGITRRNVVAEFGHPEGMKRAVMADAAIAFLMASTVQTEIKRGEIVALDIPAFRDFGLTIFLVYRSNKVLTALQKSLMREVRKGINDDLEVLRLSALN